MHNNNFNELRNTICSSTIHCAACKSYMKHNRKFLFGLLSLKFLLSCMWVLPQVADAEIPEYVVEKARNATVYVDTPLSSGSGFFVTPDKIVTNIHVIARAPIILVAGHRIEEVVGWSPKHDLVVLKLPERAGRTPLSLGTGRKNEPIFTVGFPYGKEQKVATGIIHSIRSDENLRLVAENFPHNSANLSSDGNSGGPVLNSRGEVVGVVVERGPSKITYAVSSDKLDTLLSGPAQPLNKWQQEKSVLAYASFVKGQESEGNEAIKHYDKAIYQYPSFASAYAQRGFIKFHGGRYDEAIKDLTQAIKLNSEDNETYFFRGAGNAFRGDLAAEQGDAKKAQEYYEAAINDFQKVTDFISDHIEAHGGKAMVNFDLGRLTDRQGNTKKAQEYYKAAINDFDEVINLAPNDAEAHSQRGSAKFHSGRYNEAIKDFHQAIKLNSERNEIYFLRGGTYMILGNLAAEQGDKEKAREYYNAARRDFDELIKRNPNDIKARRYLEQTELMLGEFTTD